MGDRAVITWGTDGRYDENAIGIYLHNDGEPNFVKDVLLYCELRGFREPDKDNYGYARLVQVLANYIGGGLSIGVDVCKNLDTDNGDNGTYLCKGWSIKDRLFSGSDSEEGSVSDEYRLQHLTSIDDSQPRSERLLNYNIYKLYDEWKKKQEEKKEDDSLKEIFDVDINDNNIDDLFF